MSWLKLRPKLTDIKAEIVTVKYAFYGQIDGQNFVNGPETDPSYTHKFTHDEQAAEELVTVNKVNSHATSVMAAYYDAEGNLVAVGQNDISFNEDCIATVAEPELDEVADDSLTFKASEYVIPLQDSVVMSLKAIAANKEYDLSAFAEISGIDETILALQESNLEGFTYKGLKYGTIEGDTISATVGNTKCLIGNSIYVTDQTPSAISLKPASVEGHDIFVDSDVNGQKYYMQYADEKCLLSQFSHIKYQSNSSKKKYDPIYYYINEQPFIVYATAYTSEDPTKGPTPTIKDGQIGINITDDPNVKLLDVEFSDPEYMKALGFKIQASIVDRIKVHASGVNSYNYGDDYKITAQYGQGDQAIKSDPVRLIVEAEGMNNEVIQFAAVEEGKEPTFFVPYTIDANKTKIDFKLKLMGISSVLVAFDGGESVPFYTEPLEIPTEVIATDKYPDVVKQTEFSNLIYKQDEPGLNAYTLKAEGELEANKIVKLYVEDVEGAPQYSFISITTYPNDQVTIWEINYSGCTACKYSRFFFIGRLGRREGTLFENVSVIIYKLPRGGFFLPSRRRLSLVSYFPAERLRNGSQIFRVKSAVQLFLSLRGTNKYG